MENTKVDKIKLGRLFKNAKAVLFDLDGVVIDSDSLHEEAKTATLRYFGFMLDEKDWKKIKHHATSQIYDWLHKQNPQIKAAKEEFMAYKTDYFAKFAPTKIKLVFAVLAFAQLLKEEKISLALVTATRRKAFEFFYHKFDLDQYFSVIVTAEDVKNLKPDPEAYIRAVNLLGLEAKDCVVIEDTAIGVQSGKSAGCEVVGRESTVSKEVLIEAGADAIFKDFADLL